MKKLLLASLAVSASLSGHAALQHIDEDSFYIAENRMSMVSDQVSFNMKHLQGAMGDLHLNRINHNQSAALSSTGQASAQGLLSALPQMGSDGLKIQIPPQVVSYGEIHMSMGDLINPLNYRLPDFKK